MLADQEAGTEVELGVPYRMKGRVETLVGPKTRYSVKAWKLADGEPEGCQLTAVDGATDFQSGSLLLVVHHADVTWVDVAIRPLDRGRGSGAE